MLRKVVWLLLISYFVPEGIFLVKDVQVLNAFRIEVYIPVMRSLGNYDMPGVIEKGLILTREVQGMREEIREATVHVIKIKF